MIQRTQIIGHAVEQCISLQVRATVHGDEGCRNVGGGGISGSLGECAPVIARQDGAAAWYWKTMVHPLGRVIVEDDG